MAVIELVDRNPEAKIDKPKKVETKDKSKVPQEKVASK